MVNLIKSCDLCERQTNKQFNSDSQRLALSLRVEFSVYGALFKFSVCAAHTLIGRYVFFDFQWVKWFQGCDSLASLAVWSSSLSNSALSVQILEFLYRLYASIFVGCFNSKSRLRVDSFSGVKSLSVYLPNSISAWQLYRQFAIVLRFK